MAEPEAESIAELPRTVAAGLEDWARASRKLELASLREDEGPTPRARLLPGSVLFDLRIEVFRDSQQRVFFFFRGDPIETRPLSARIQVEARPRPDDGRPARISELIRLSRPRNFDLLEEDHARLVVAGKVLEFRRFASFRGRDIDFERLEIVYDGERLRRRVGSATEGEGSYPIAAFSALLETIQGWGPGDGQTDELFLPMALDGAPVPFGPPETGLRRLVTAMIASQRVLEGRTAELVPFQDARTELTHYAASLSLRVDTAGEIDWEGERSASRIKVEFMRKSSERGALTEVLVGKPDVVVDDALLGAFRSAMTAPDALRELDDCYRLVRSQGWLREDVRDFVTAAFDAKRVLALRIDSRRGLDREVLVLEGEPEARGAIRLIIQADFRVQVRSATASYEGGMRRLTDWGIRVPDQTAVDDALVVFFVQLLRSVQRWSRVS